MGIWGCPYGETCSDLTSDDISPDICNENDNVVRGTHNCFAHGYHHAWCGVDGNGNAAVAECDQPFKYVHKIEVRDTTFVYSYAPWTMLVMTNPAVGGNSKTANLFDSLLCSLQNLKTYVSLMKNK